MDGTNSFTARESYLLARGMFYDALRDKFPEGAAGDAKCKAWVNSLYLTQGEVRVEIELNANNNIYQFAVTPNQTNSNNGQVFNTEIRLPLQDSLCATEMQIFVMRPLSLVDAVLTPAQDGTLGLLRTYGNTQDFTANAAQTLDSTFYSHGQFQFTRNGVKIVRNRGLVNWWYKGQTQQTAALGANSPGDQIQGVEVASCTLQPNIVLIGSSDNEPLIKLPSNLAVVDSFTRAVIIFKGPYAQNSTVIN